MLQTNYLPNQWSEFDKKPHTLTYFHPHQEGLQGGKKEVETKMLMKREHIQQWLVGKGYQTNDQYIVNFATIGHHARMHQDKPKHHLSPNPYKAKNHLKPKQQPK